MSKHRGSSQHQAARSVAARYRDGYRAAGWIIGMGTILKIIAVLVAVVVFAVLAEVLDQMAISLVISLPVGLVIWVSGVLTAAQGQLLRAALDSAVNSSPFLSEAQRAEVMQLGIRESELNTDADPASTPDSVPVPLMGSADGRGEPSDSAVEEFCYHCGATLKGATATCPACGKAL